MTFRSDTVFFLFIYFLREVFSGTWPGVLALDSLSGLTAEHGVRAGGAESERGRRKKKKHTAPCKYFMAIGQQDVNVVFLLCCDFPAKVSPVTD